MAKVLIVDDILENLYLLEAILTSRGFKVLTASHGNEALTKAAQEPPDIIISDILMPVMDGFTFCIRCKNDPQLKRIPFVFYTATYTEPKDEEFALSLGADLFILKPVEPIDLIKKIDDLLQDHANRRELVTEEMGVVEKVNLKEYNEILIHKLERKMAQLDATNKDLLESENRFRRLAEKSPALIYRIILPERIVAYINPVVTELTGFSPEEFYENPLLIYDYLFDPTWRDRFEEHFNAILGGETHPPYEYQIYLKSGKTRWVQQRIVVVRDGSGQPLSIEGILIDQTDSIRSKQVIQESEQRYRKLFERVPIGLYRITRNGQVTDVNPAWLDMLGYPSLDSVKGINFQDFYNDSKDCQRWQAQMQQEGIIAGYESQWRHASGAILWVEESARAIEDTKGEVLYYEGSVKDITGRKQIEQAMRQLNVELERRVIERTSQLEDTNQELEAFSYSVSHDLRAPLRSLDGFSKLLIEEKADLLDEEGLSFLNRIHAASQHMQRLIDDLLKLSRVTRGELNITQVNLSELSERISVDLNETQPDRQVMWKIAPGVIASGDRGLLEVALCNLLHNAFKFTSQHPAAQIEFGVQEQEGQSVYYVSDNGIGFDKQHAQMLFGYFRRLPSAQKFEGTGIGLTIVRRIINRHGGRIWADGVINQGATFFFTLGKASID